MGQVLDAILQYLLTKQDDIVEWLAHRLLGLELIMVDGFDYDED